MDVGAINGLLARLNDDQRRVAELGPGPAAVAGGPGCLRGDSELIYLRGNRSGGRKITIAKLWQRHRGKVGSQYYPWKDPMLATYIQSHAADGRIYYNQLVDVVSSGKKSCLELTTNSDRSITCTGEHRFRTADGAWCRADELSVGDELLCRGNMRSRKGAGRQAVKSRQTIAIKFHKFGPIKVKLGKYVFREVPLHRLVVEADLNGMDFDDFIYVLNNEPTAVEKLQFLPSGLDIHHKDEDPKNNALANLQIFTQRGHARLHGKLGNFNVEYTKIESVKNIKPAGYRNTYDLMMEGPDNNYVANGFVVHNSGKTTALVARIARLIRDGLDPEFILAMTFTRLAAREMKERLQNMGVEVGRICTIHSLSHEIIKSAMPDQMMGLQLDESGYKADMELQRALGDLRRDKILNKRSVELDGIKRFIMTAKGSGVCPVYGNPFGLNDVGEAVIHDLAKKFYNDSGGVSSTVLTHLYTHLEHRRAAANTFDYDDMQAWAWLSLIAYEGELQMWQRMWSLVFIDEAQDSSPIQWDMARLLARGRSRICPERTASLDAQPPALTAYGESSQSIFGWRCAIPEWFVDYATAEGVGLYTMPINYRSGPEICWATSRIVDDQDWHITGEITSASETKLSQRELAARICLVECKDLQKETAFVIDRAEQLAEGDLSRVVVLCRLSMFLHLLEFECIRRGIPYEKRAGGGFIDSHEVQDLLAYMRVASGYDQTNKWMKRCIRVPFRYIGRPALSWADGQRSGSYLETLMQAPMLSARQRRSLAGLEDTLESLEALIRVGESPRTCLKFIIDDTMYLEWLKEKGGANTIDASKMAVIDHLSGLAGAFPDVHAFLSGIDQMTAGLKVGREAVKGEGGNRLVLSTIHRAKALEWDHVLIGDVSEGRFPWNKGHTPDEELRLLYVAVSRARASVTLSWSDKPSSHIKKLRTILRQKEAKGTSGPHCS